MAKTPTTPEQATTAATVKVLKRTESRLRRLSKHRSKPVWRHSYAEAARKVHEVLADMR